jgi:wobble nucleotide-excising tRNase
MAPEVSDHGVGLEGRLTSLEIKVAVLESNQKEVDKKLDKIDTNISKLTWIVVGAVVLAILNSVLQGGVSL